MPTLVQFRKWIAPVPNRDNADEGLRTRAFLVWVGHPSPFGQAGAMSMNTIRDMY
jgi:hypothetical protein